MARHHYRVRHHHRHNPRHHYSYRRRRHNPGPFGGISARTVTTAAWVSAGAIAARALPETFFAKFNRDISGYALNAGAAVLSSWVAGMVSGAATEPVLIGGIAATILRIVSDNLGQRYGFLKGDRGFNLGLYAPSYFAVPTVSDPYGRTLTSPYAFPATLEAPASGAVYVAPAAAVVAGMGRAARYRGRYT